MEIIKKYPKAIQWIFLLIVFFSLCFAIQIPEGYEFAKAGTEFIDKDKLDQTKYSVLWRLPAFIAWMPGWINDSVYFLLNDKNTLPLGISFDECERTFIFPLLHCVSIILCLPVLLTFKTLTGIPSLLKETNSGLIPISVLEKFDFLI